MGLFRFRWLYRFVRRNTKPIPEDKAALWKRRLSIGYMLIAWNTVGIIIYLFVTGKPDLGAYYGLKTDDELSKKPAVYYAELLGIKKAHVVSFRGIKKVNDYDYNNDEEDN